MAIMVYQPYDICHSWCHIGTSFNGCVTLWHTLKFTSHCTNNPRKNHNVTFINVNVALWQPSRVMPHRDVHQISHHIATLINVLVIMRSSKKFMSHFDNNHWSTMVDFGWPWLNMTMLMVKCSHPLITMDFHVWTWLDMVDPCWTCLTMFGWPWLTNILTVVVVYVALCHPSMVMSHCDVHWS